MIAKSKRHWACYSKTKREHTDNVANIIGKCPTYQRVFINFQWIEPNKRRDPDNIASARKFVLDGMVKAGLIPDDSWNYIDGWTDTFFVDKSRPGVIVEVSDVQ